MEAWVNLKGTGQTVSSARRNVKMIIRIKYAEFVYTNKNYWVIFFPSIKAFCCTRKIQKK